MQAAEEYVACRGYHTLHLSTHDMQGFYRHLGYQDGPPVTALRSCVAKLSSEQVGRWLWTVQCEKQSCTCSTMSISPIRFRCYFTRLLILPL